MPHPPAPARSFPQITATALLCKDMFEFATDEHDENLWVTPWVDLAKELGYQELVDAFGKASPVQWHLDFG